VHDFSLNNFDLEKLTDKVATYCADITGHSICSAVFVPIYEFGFTEMTFEQVLETRGKILASGPVMFWAYGRYRNYCSKIFGMDETSSESSKFMFDTFVCQTFGTAVYALYLWSSGVPPDVLQDTLIGGVAFQMIDGRVRGWFMDKWYPVFGLEPVLKERVEEELSIPEVKPYEDIPGNKLVSARF